MCEDESGEHQDQPSKAFFFAQALKRDPSNVPSAPRQIQPLGTGTGSLAYSRYIVISSIKIDKLYKA